MKSQFSDCEELLGKTPPGVSLLQFLKLNSAEHSAHIAMLQLASPSMFCHLPSRLGVQKVPADSATLCKLKPLLQSKPS